MSWVTRSPTSNTSTTGSAAGLNGLLARCFGRRPLGVVIPSSMTLRSRSCGIPAESLLRHRPRSGRARPEKSLHVGRLPQVLEAVTQDAHEPYAGRDRRVPPLVDLALELRLVDGLQVARGRERHLVVVLREQRGVLDPQRGDLLARVAVADVVGAVGQAEAILEPLPDLWLPGEVGDVVVLDPRQVPQQPPDRVAGAARAVVEGLVVDVLDDAGVELGDAAEALGQQSTHVHGVT